MNKKSNWKLGYIPALLAVLLTFSLGWASAGLVSGVLGVEWLKWPLRIAFLAGEFLVLSWYFEPQKGYYTSDQMKWIQSAKYVLMGGGLIDGVLIIVAMKMADPPWLVFAAQAGVTIFVIFYCAAASMVLIDKDSDRIISIERASVRLQGLLETARLELEQRRDMIETQRIQLRINREIRAQVRKSALDELQSKEVRGALAELGKNLSRAVIFKFGENASKKLKIDVGSFKLDTPQEVGEGDEKKPLPLPVIDVSVGGDGYANPK